MDKIKIILKESGTVADLKMNFKIYQGSAQNAVLNVLVPKNIVEGKLCTQYATSNGEIVTENGVFTACKVGEVYVERDGRLGKTQSYYMRYLKEIHLPEGDFLLYERMFPREFTKVSGTGLAAPKLIVNVENILNNITVGEDGTTITNEPTILSLITSQECRIPVEPSTNLDADPVFEPSELDLLSGQMNEVYQQVNSKVNFKDAVLKFNLLEKLPSTISYEKNGYKSLGVHFYNETHNVPLNSTQKQDKVGEVYVTNMRPHETELYQAYQDEIFSFDIGICKRTILLNTVQQSIGQYSVLKVGEWQTVGVEYLEALQRDIDSNLSEINSLKGRSSRYVVHLENNIAPSQEELLIAFQEASKLEIPADGTTLIDMDNNKEYTYFETSKQWIDRGASTVSSFTNKASGVLVGSEEDGFIKAVEGKGKVSGWETVKNDIQKNKDDIKTKVNKVDLPKVAVDKTLSEGEKSVIETVKYKDLTTNSIIEETIEIKGVDGVSVSKTNEGIAVEIDEETRNNLAKNTEDISENKKEISNIKNDYVPKANIENPVVSDTSFEVGETGALKQTETATDLKTGVVSTKQKTAIPVVEGKARLFLPQEQDTLRDLNQWRASMQGEALSWQTTLDGIPNGETSSAEVQAFLTDKYHQVVGKVIDPLDQTTLSDENLGVTYKWYSNDNAWILSHGSPNSIASNNFYGEDGNMTYAGHTGTVVGSNRKFHGFVETNGEISIIGLDELEQSVKDNSDAIVEEEKKRIQAIANEQKRAEGVEKANADEIAKKVNKTTKVAGKSLEEDVSLEFLTIKQNGVSKGTYSGDEAKEIDIQTPTKTSEIVNDGDGTKINGNTDPYAKVSQIPTDNNQLGNGAGYSKQTDLEALESRVLALEQHPFLTKVKYDESTDTFTI